MNNIREKIHQLLDTLPEEALPLAERYLEKLAEKQAFDREAYAFWFNDKDEEYETQYRHLRLVTDEERSGAIPLDKDTYAFLLEDEDNWWKKPIEKEAE
jgi:hypothetical protein